MPEIVQFVHHGASQITPKVLRGVHKKLPFLKMEFAQINAPKYPHLVDQLEFLADVVEDFAEGADDDLPYAAVAAAKAANKAATSNASTAATVSVTGANASATTASIRTKAARATKAAATPRSTSSARRCRRCRKASRNIR